MSKRPGEELAPHIAELFRELFPRGRHTTALLDLLPLAGPEAFRGVAPQVYGITEGRGFVIEVLGKLGDASPEALAIYREALENDEALDNVFDAIKRIAKRPSARSLSKALKSRLAQWRAPKQAKAIALMAQLGEPVVVRVRTFLGDCDAEALAALVEGLAGLPLRELAPELQARFRSLDPEDDEILTAIEAFVEVGIDEPVTMEPLVRRRFLPRGAYWTERAEALLARWAPSGARRSRSR